MYEEKEVGQYQFIDMLTVTRTKIECNNENDVITKKIYEKGNMQYKEKDQKEIHNMKLDIREKERNNIRIF